MPEQLDLGRCTDKSQEEKEADVSVRILGGEKLKLDNNVRLDTTVAKSTQAMETKLVIIDEYSLTTRKLNGK